MELGQAPAAQRKSPGVGRPRQDSQHGCSPNHHDDQSDDLVALGSRELGEEVALDDACDDQQQDAERNPADSRNAARNLKTLCSWNRLDCPYSEQAPWQSHQKGGIV